MFFLKSLADRRKTTAFHGRIAQLVELPAHNRLVTGSSPVASTMSSSDIADVASKLAAAISFIHLSGSVVMQSPTISTYLAGLH